MITMTMMAVAIFLILLFCVVCVLRLNSVEKENLRRSETQAEELRNTRERLDEAMHRVSDLTFRLEQRADEQRRVAATEFRSVAEEVMRGQAESLRDSNSRQVDAVLTPLREQIADFRKAVNDSYVSDNATRRSLSDQIERLMRLNMTIGEEARNLTAALKGDSKVQGDWGEMILETLLEAAGMKRDIHFSVQAASDMNGKSFRDEESGRGLRPDVILFLPGERVMVIDSKVSLTAFVEWNSASSPEEKKRAASRHLQSVKKHVDELSAKKYQNLMSDSLDQVLMFIPNEGAWSLAFSLDPALWKYAFERKVAIVSPAHLFPVIHLVTQMWRQEKQNRNVEEIARLGGLLYDKFVKFTSDFAAIEASLRKAEKAYDDCRRDLSYGSQSLVARAERLRTLGARTSRRLPLDIIATSDEVKD